MTQAPFGLLVMAYGTPRNLSEVEPYYTHIRRGRPPTPEQLAALCGRYAAIGGVSPLHEITLQQAQGVANILNADGKRACRVYLGMKHAQPFIEDAVAQMAHDGLTDAVTLVLAPHYSTMSVAVYQQNATQAAVAYHFPRLVQVDAWHLQPRLLTVLAERVQTALQQFDNPNDVHVIFTAHSLPERILSVQDPYPTQLQETGTAVAKQLNLGRFDFAWQSAGRTPEPWLGPDILDHLQTLQADGVRNVVVCPCGFVSDHLEVLYDIDIEAQQRAKALGMRIVRTQSLNTDPRFLLALAEVVREHAAQLDGGQA